MTQLQPTFGGNLGEIIIEVENSAPGFIADDCWTRKGSYSSAPAGTNGCSAKWYPHEIQDAGCGEPPDPCRGTSVFVSGTYDIFVRIPDVETRTRAARYTIHHTDNSGRIQSTTIVVQAVYPNNNNTDNESFVEHDLEWAYIGQYTFTDVEKDIAGYVDHIEIHADSLLTDDQAGAQVVASDIRLIRSQRSLGGSPIEEWEATYSGEYDVDISWQTNPGSPVSNIEEYRIYRGTTDQFSNARLVHRETGVSGVSQYSHTDVVPSANNPYTEQATRYYYWISEYRNDGIENILDPKTVGIIGYSKDAFIDVTTIAERLIRDQRMGTAIVDIDSNRVVMRLSSHFDTPPIERDLFPILWKNPDWDMSDFDLYGAFFLAREDGYEAKSAFPLGTEVKFESNGVFYGWLYWRNATYSVVFGKEDDIDTTVVNVQSPKTVTAYTLYSQPNDVVCAAEYIVREAHKYYKLHSCKTVTVAGDSLISFRVPERQFDEYGVAYLSRSASPAQVIAATPYTGIHRSQRDSGDSWTFYTWQRGKIANNGVVLDRGSPFAATTIDEPSCSNNGTCTIFDFVCEPFGCAFAFPTQVNQSLDGTTVELDP